MHLMSPMSMCTYCCWLGHLKKLPVWLICLTAVVIICNKTSPKWSAAWYRCGKDSFTWQLSVSSSQVWRHFKACAHWRCLKHRRVELMWELSSWMGFIYVAETSPPADQQAIAKHRGGLPVHNYTNRSIAITRGPGTEHCPSIAAHLNQPKHQ